MLYCNNQSFFSEKVIFFVYSKIKVYLSQILEYCLMKMLYKTNPILSLPVVGKLTNKWLAYGLSLMLFLACIMSGKAQEINLQGNGANITDGDITPTNANFTTFGNVVINTSMTRTYTIQNTDGVMLNISGITSGNAKFVVSGSPTFVAAASSATFTVTYTPTDETDDLATITINNNDADEAIYNFNIQGVEFAYIPNQSTNNVYVINNSTNIVDAIIMVGTGPIGIAVSPDGSKVYVANISADNISVIDTRTNIVVTTIAVGTAPIGIAVSPDGSKLYVGNGGSDNVSVINTNTNLIVATITVGVNPYGIAVSPDGGKVYVVNNNSNNVSVINTSTEIVVATVAVNASPLAIAIAPDGSKAYVVNIGGGNVSVINTNTNVIDATIVVGVNPRCVSVSPNGNRAYVANLGADNVSVINTSTNIVVATVAVGTYPYGITVSPNGGKVYATNLTGDNVSVINTITNVVDATVIVGANPTGFGNMMRLVYPVLVPEINLQSNAQNITSTDITPSTTDNTDFSITGLAGKTLTYTIQNTGTGNLTLTGTAPNYVTLSGSSDFSVISQPSSNIIAAGGAVTFTVKLLPTGANGVKTATVSITNDDSNENPYTFAIQGYKVNAIPDTKRGNMVTLDGVNQYIAITSNPLAAATNMTIEAWLYPTNLSDWARVIDFGNLPGDNMFLTSSYWGSGGLPRFAINVGGGGEEIVESTTPFTLNTWTHIAVTLSGTTAIMYLDGVNVGQNNAFMNTPSSLGATVNNWFGKSQYPDPYLGGSLDEVRIWNTARTQAQIRENMHLTLSGVESGLVAYYQFNETTGNAIDAVSGNNGTLVSVNRSASTVSVGKGVSKTVVVTSVGAGSEIDLTNTQMEIDFSAGSANPNGEIVISQITSETPYQNTNASVNTTSCYWIVRNFGVNTGLAFDNLKFQIPNHNTISTADQTTPTNLKLYHRSTNVGGTWAEIGGANSANNTTKQINFDVPTNTSFSEFIIGSTISPLPITLITFNGERIEKAGERTEEVKLTWATASEVNNKGFEVQVSEDAQNYKAIAFIEGRGNSTTVSSYRLAVSNSNDGYYRLKQLDFDGKFSYSPIVFVEGIEFLKVYPNPNNGTFKVVCGTQTTADKLDLPARLLNAQGVEVWRGIQTEVKTNLPAGMYFLHTTVAGKNRVTKVIIEN